MSQDKALSVELGIHTSFTEKYAICELPTFKQVSSHLVESIKHHDQKCIYFMFLDFFHHKFNFDPGCPLRGGFYYFFLSNMLWDFGEGALLVVTLGGKSEMPSGKKKHEENTTKTTV